MASELPITPPPPAEPSSRAPSHHLFRKAALAHQDSPDRLDQLVRVVPPIGWLVLWTVIGLLSVAVIWGFLGRIPHTVEGTGILLRGGTMEGVAAPGQGQLTRILVSVGDIVKPGQEIAAVEQPTLISRIANQRHTVADYQSQLDALQIASTKQLDSQSEFYRKQRASVTSSISDYQEQEKSLQTVVTAQKELLGEGLIPLTTLLQSQTQLDSTNLNILQAESQLQQIETNEIQSRSTAQQSIDSGRVSLQQASAELADMEAQLARNASVVSTSSGRVVSIDAAAGQSIDAGTPIVTLERHEEPMQALMFFPSGKGKEIEPGMTLQISPESARVDRFGYIVGEVTRVGDVPATKGSMMAALANDELVSSVSSDGTVLTVTGFPHADPSEPSGFKWSSSSGPPFAITSGSICKTRVITSELRPIELVIPMLKKFFGVAE